MTTPQIKIMLILLTYKNPICAQTMVDSRDAAFKGRAI